MTISAKLLHKVLNRLTSVQGFIELGASEADEAKRRRLYEKAHEEIRKLQTLLEQHRRGTL